MKKSIIIISIFILSVTSLTLLAIQFKNKPLKQSKQVEPALISEAKPEKVNIPQKIKVISEEIDKIEQYAKEFNMPAELKEELTQAVKKGAVDTHWGEKEISKKELDDAGLSLKKLAKQKPDSKTENITAGYIVNGVKFEKMLVACNPAKDDSPQEKEFKKQALDELGFSALTENNQEKLKEVVNSLKNAYSEIPKESIANISETPIPDMPEIQRVPMIDLEYAFQLLEEGRKDEALKIIDEAISQNQGDKEFVEVAEALRDNINKYE